VPSVTRSAEVRIPASRAYDYLKGGDHVKDWIPDVSRSERITPGPVHVGSRIVFAIRVANHDFEITNEITHLREPELVGFRAVAGVPNHGHFEVKAVSPSVSIVTLHFEFELPRGPVGALARFLPVDRIIDHYAQSSLARLVQKLESLDASPAAQPSTKPTETGEP
jgi:uncharacterized membrane protein